MTFESFELALKDKYVKSEEVFGFNISNHCPAPTHGRPAPPRRRPSALQAQLDADLASLAAEFPPWSVACRAAWARTVLAIATENKLSIDPSIKSRIVYFSTQR